MRILRPTFPRLRGNVDNLKKQGLIPTLKVFGSSIKVARGDSTDFNVILSENDLKDNFSYDELAVLNNAGYR